MDSLKKVFEKVAKQNTWANPDSLSGRGSNLEQTTVIRKEIPKLIKKYAFKTMLDAPCGDDHPEGLTCCGHETAAPQAPRCRAVGSARRRSHNRRFHT